MLERGPSGGRAPRRRSSRVTEVDVPYNSMREFFNSVSNVEMVNQQRSANATSNLASGLYDRDLYASELQRQLLRSFREMESQVRRSSSQNNSSVATMRKTSNQKVTVSSNKNNSSSKPKGTRDLGSFATDSDFEDDLTDSDDDDVEIKKEVKKKKPPVTPARQNVASQSTTEDLFERRHSAFVGNWDRYRIEPIRPSLVVPRERLFTAVEYESETDSSDDDSIENEISFYRQLYETGLEEPPLPPPPPPLRPRRPLRSQVCICPSETPCVCNKTQVHDVDGEDNCTEIIEDEADYDDTSVAETEDEEESVPLTFRQVHMEII